MFKLRNPFKKQREKDPDKVRAGRLGGIRSGEVRRVKKVNKLIEKDLSMKIKLTMTVLPVLVALSALSQAVKDKEAKQFYSY